MWDIATSGLRNLSPVHTGDKVDTVANTVDKSATKSTVDFVADTFDFVANLSLVCRKSTVAGSFDFVDPIAVDIVAKVEHLQLGRKWVIFVARMSNVLSTVASVYVASVYGAKATRSTFSTFDKVDMSNSTLEPVCTGL